MAVEVKICGLTNVADATVARDAGADYLGFVLYPKSPRAISEDALLEVLSGVGDGVRVVPVFVNAAVDDVLRVARAAGAHAVQIHGDEPPDPFLKLEFPVWRAVHFRAGTPHPDPAEWPAQRYVIDAAAPGEYGGSGTKADWVRACEFARQHPTMLAGGLTPENVTAAINCVGPLGVDVASGVERVPGRKDPGKVRAFIRAGKGTEAGK